MTKETDPELESGELSVRMAGRFQCTFCQHGVPWTIDLARLGLQATEAPEDGVLYAFDDCPCGYGKFVRYEKFTTDGRHVDTSASAESSLPSRVNSAEYMDLPVNMVRPNPKQPRRHFDADALRTLAESIARVGLLEDILVRRVAEYFEIVLGERRWRATRLAGLESIKAKVADLNEAEAQEIALMENLQREDLTAVEEAFAFKSYVDTGDDISGVGARFGGLQQRVAERLSVLNSHHYIEYQAEQIRKYSDTVRRLEARLERGGGQYDASIVEESALVGHVGEGFEIVARLSSDQYLIRRLRSAEE